MISVRPAAIAAPIQAARNAPAGRGGGGGPPPRGWPGPAGGAPRGPPSRGNGPQPKMRHGDRGMSAAAPTDVTAAGTAMLPVPRITFASELKIQITMAPEKTTLE